MTQAVSYLQYKVRAGRRSDARAAFPIFDAALHEHCLARARARGSRKLVLTTDVQFVSARRFYERLGWVRAPDLPIPARETRHYALDLTRQG